MRVRWISYHGAIDYRSRMGEAVMSPTMQTVFGVSGTECLLIFFPITEHRLSLIWNAIDFSLRLSAAIGASRPVPARREVRWPVCRHPTALLVVRQSTG